MEGSDFSGMSLEVCEVEMIRQSLLLSRESVHDNDSVIVILKINFKKKNRV